MVQDIINLLVLHLLIKHQKYDCGLKKKIKICGTKTKNALRIIVFVHEETSCSGPNELMSNIRHRNKYDFKSYYTRRRETSQNQKRICRIAVSVTETRWSKELTTRRDNIVIHRSGFGGILILTRRGLRTYDSRERRYRKHGRFVDPAKPIPTAAKRTVFYSGKRVKNRAVLLKSRAHGCDRATVFEQLLERQPSLRCPACSAY